MSGLFRRRWNANHGSAADKWTLDVDQPNKKLIILTAEFDNFCGASELLSE